MAAITLTQSNFEKEVMESGKTVLIDFWASWCGPCRMLSPVIDELSNEVPGDVIIGKVNVDEERELAMQYNVMSIPTVVVIKGGKVVATSVGVQPKVQLLEMLAKAK